MRKITMRTLAFILFLLAPIPGLASDAGSFLLITADGHYGIHWLDGTPQVFRFEAVVDLRAATPAPPEPLPPPEPEPPTEGLVADVQRWAEDVGDPVGAAIMARIYRNAAAAVASGEQSIGSVSDEIGRRIDSGVPSVDQWQDFRKRVSGAWAERVQRGELSTAEQWVVFLSEIAKGLEASR